MAPASDEGRRRVLITGAGGFIGRHLVAAQAALGRDVVALDLDLSPLTPLPIRTLEGDVADPALQDRALDGTDTVFHLAAAHLSVSAGESVHWQVNVEALRSLVDRSRQAGIRRFVHCSTVGVFGALRTLPADEDSPCSPEYDYEKTKLEGEKLLLEAFQSHGFPVTILRPAWVYGPGCPRTEKLFRAIRRGRFLLAGGGRTYRHSVYIRDMVDAFESAGNADAVLGKVIIIADDEAVTVRDLVLQVAHTVGASMPHSVPYWLLHAAAAATETVFGWAGKEPPFSTRSLRFFSGNTSFRTERARSLLGFRPRYGIAQGLRETQEIMEQGAFWTVPLPQTTPGWSP